MFVTRVKLFWTRVKLWFDRTVSSNGHRQWAIPVISFGVSFITFFLILFIINKGWCLLGGADYSATDSYVPDNVLDAAFYHMFTNGGQNLFVSHFWGAVITVVGLIVIAILTSSITNFFEQRAKQYLSGETSYYFSNHFVVFGTNDVLYSIINQIKDQDFSYIVIQTGKKVESARREVFSFIKDIDTTRIVFLYGDRTSLQDVNKLHLESAKEVFIIGDTTENENGESYRDAYNIDCIKTIKESISIKTIENDLLRRKVILEQIENENDSQEESRLKAVIKQIEKRLNEREHLRCNIMFEYQTTFSAFQDSDIDYDYKAYLDFEPFSFHETWAQKVFVENNDYKPLDQTGPESYIDKDSEQSVHLIIVGMSKMGVALALEAAQICHFPNYVTKGKKTRITFIDSDADIEQEFFSGRLSQLKILSKWEFRDASSSGFKYNHDLSSVPEAGQDWLDIEWEFIRGRIEQESIRQYLSDAVSDNNHIVTLAICFPLSHQAIAAALYLPETVYDKCLQILVYQRISKSLVSQLASNVNGRLANLKAFGMVENAFSSALHDDTKAMMVAYAYDKLYDELDRLKTEATKSAADGEIIDVKKLYDSVDWDKVDYKLVNFNQSSYSKGRWRMRIVNRWSSRANANSLKGKLRSVKSDSQMPIEEMQTILMNNLHLLMQMEHNRWNIEKLIAGYRPLSDEEIIKLPEYATDEWQSYVDSLKNKKTHIDLCDCQILKKRDYNNIGYDEVLIRAIPYIIMHSKSVNDA